MSIFDSIGKYLFHDAPTFEKHGVDTDNPVAVEYEMDSLKRGDSISSSLDVRSFDLHSKSVQETGHCDSLTESIFDSLGGDSSSSSDSGSSFVSDFFSGSSSDSGSSFVSDLFSDSKSDSDSGGGFW